MDSRKKCGCHEPPLSTPRRARRGGYHGPADAVAADTPVGHRVENLVVPGSFCERVPACVCSRSTCISGTPPTRRAARRGPRRLHVPAVRQAAAPRDRLGAAVLDGRGRDCARGRGGRAGRRAVRADRVLARRDQRPDRLRAHAGGDRGAGFIVAAPGHTSNTQDDVRIDFINEQAACAADLCYANERCSTASTGWPRAPSAAAGPGPDCARAASRTAWRDRARDISTVLTGCLAGSAAAST